MTYNIFKKLEQIYQQNWLILARLNTLTHMETSMAVDLSKLTSAVAAEKTVDASVLALLNGLTTKISDLGEKLAEAIAANDPAAQAALQAQIDDLTTQLTDEAAALAAAVSANTPAAPPAPTG